MTRVVYITPKELLDIVKQADSVVMVGELPKDIPPKPVGGLAWLPKTKQWLVVKEHKHGST